MRAFVLVVLPQPLRAPAEATGYARQPASTQARTARALLDTLDLPAMPTTGHVVAADLEQVTLDLAPVPLDEVLDFRRQHGDQHRAYARDLRQFVRDAAALTQTDQEQPSSTGAKPSPTPQTSSDGSPGRLGGALSPPSGLA